MGGGGGGCAKETPGGPDAANGQRNLATLDCERQLTPAKSTTYSVGINKETRKCDLAESTQTNDDVRRDSKAGASSEIKNEGRGEQVTTSVKTTSTRENIQPSLIVWESSSLGPGKTPQKAGQARRLSRVANRRPGLGEKGAYGLQPPKPTGEKDKGGNLEGPGLLGENGRVLCQSGGPHLGGKSRWRTRQAGQGGTGEGPSKKAAAGRRDQGNGDRRRKVDPLRPKASTQDEAGVGRFPLGLQTQGQNGSSIPEGSPTNPTKGKKVQGKPMGQGTVASQGNGAKVAGRVPFLAAGRGVENPAGKGGETKTRGNGRKADRKKSRRKTQVVPRPGVSVARWCSEHGFRRHSQTRPSGI